MPADCQYRQIGTRASGASLRAQRIAAYMSHLRSVYLSESGRRRPVAGWLHGEALVSLFAITS